MLAVRPNYHSPALTAKALSTLDMIAPGPGVAERGVVLVEGRGRAVRRAVRRARRAVRADAGMAGRGRPAAARGHRDPLGPAVPAGRDRARAQAVPPAVVYMGGESPRAKEVIAAQADAYVMHGDAPEVIAGKVADLNGRRAEAGQPPMVFGVSGYVICRDTEEEAQAELDRILDVRSSPEAYASYQDFVEGSQLESRVSLEEYSVSNRGLRSGLIGTPRADHRPAPGVRGRRGGPDAAAVLPAAGGDGPVRRRGDQPVPVAAAGCLG